MTDEEANAVIEAAGVGSIPDDLIGRVPENDDLLSEAMAKAQAGFGHIARTKTVAVRTQTGPGYTFSYAPLEVILKAVLPSLNKHGFALTQAVEPTDGQGQVVTTLTHRLGSRSNRVPLFVAGQTGQAFGSAVTYARRMGVTLLLCVAADDDDDGNAAAGNEATELPKKPIGKPVETVAKEKAVPRPQAPTDPVELSRCEGIIADAMQELIEAASEGRAHGIEQIWNEIKNNHWVASEVWDRLKWREPHVFATIKSVLRPEPDRKARGPKP